MKLKRKLYTRGSSYETTIPMPLLFDKNLKKKHEIIFSYDNKAKKWYIEIEEAK